MEKKESKEVKKPRHREKKANRGIGLVTFFCCPLAEIAPDASGKKVLQMYLQPHLNEKKLPVFSSMGFNNLFHSLNKRLLLVFEVNIDLGCGKLLQHLQEVSKVSSISTYWALIVENKLELKYPIQSG